MQTKQKLKSKRKLKGIPKKHSENMELNSKHDFFMIPENKNNINCNFRKDKQVMSL